MMSFTNIRILPENAVLTISGGTDGEKGIQPKIYATGSEHGMSAKAGLEIPVTPNLSVTPYAQGDTRNGVTGSGIKVTWDLPQPF